MRAFVNTVDIVGDDALTDSILQRTISGEFNDNRITKIGRNAFRFCSSLTSVNFPSVITIGDEGFAWCSGLKTVDLAAIESIGNAFGWTYALTTMIIRNPTKVCTFSSGFESGSPLGEGRGQIYVPTAFLDEYKAATNWSAYAGQLLALEEWTDDGTVYGDLVSYKVSNRLFYVSSSNSASKTGNRYTATLTADTEIEEVSITMGGVDITAEVYNAETGEINIPLVTGDLVITAKARLKGVLAPTEYSVADMSGVLEVKTGGYYTTSGAWVNDGGYQSWKVPCESGEEWEQYSTSGYGMFKVLWDDADNFVSSFTPANGNPTAFTIPDGDGVAYMWTAVGNSDITDGSFRLVRNSDVIPTIHIFTADNATPTSWVDEVDSSYQFDFTGSPTVADGYVNFTSSSYGILNKNLGLNGVDSTLIVRFVVDSSASETWVLGTPNWSNGVIVGKKSGNFHVESRGMSLIQCAKADANEHEIALCFEASTNTIHAYFDGVSCGSSSAASLATWLNNLLYLNYEGASFNAANKVSRILIYDRMLTADEVSSLFETGG